MAENEKGPAGLFLGNHVLNLRENIRLPGRDIRRLLMFLIPHVRNPHAGQVRRLSPGPGSDEWVGQRRGTANDRDPLRNNIHADVPFFFESPIATMVEGIWRAHSAIRCPTTYYQPRSQKESCPEAPDFTIPGAVLSIAGGM
jgi:hypothetical protein